MLTHQFAPIYNEQSKILILGTFPSVKSREQNFYYGHPQNRFWRVLAGILECEVPTDIDEKKRMLLQGKIAIWDVIASCDIQGSSDSSIRNVILNDINVILQNSDVQAIYTNGKTAQKLFDKYLKPRSGRESIALPSTSPANAACSLERLTEEWSQIKQYL